MSDQLYAYVIFALLKKLFKKKFKNNLYTCKQPLMMTFEGSENARDNFCKFIYQRYSKTYPETWKDPNEII